MDQIPPRGFFVPTEVMFSPLIPPPVRDTWIQLRAMAGAGDTLHLEGGIKSLAEMTGKSTQTLYGHMAVLRNMGALRWRGTKGSELFVTFDDKSFLVYLSKIFNDPSLINTINLSTNSIKERGGSKNLENKKDPNLFDPAVKMYRTVMHLTANETQRKMIVGAVGGDLQGWQACLEHWAGHGWSPTNITGMLDSFKKGGKTACTGCNHNGNGHKPARVVSSPGSFTRAEMDVIMERDPNAPRKEIPF